MHLIWQYLKKQKGKLALALVLATINQVFSLLDTQVFRMVVDRYVLKAQEFSQTEFVRGVVVLLLVSMGAAFVSRVAKNFQDYFVNVITQRMSTSMYEQSVKHSFSLPYAVFEDQQSGELLRILQKARDDAQKFVDGMINVVFLSLVGIVFVIGYAVSVHWSIGVAYFLIIPVLGVANVVISKRIKKIQSSINRQTAGLAGSTTETMRNVELVKSMGLEDQEVKRLNAVNEHILALELEKIKMVRKLNFIQGTSINAVRSLLLLLMLWLIFQGQVSVGEYFTLMVYSFFIFTPLAQFGTVTTQYQEVRASSEQLAGVLAMQPEVLPQKPQPVSTLKHLVFQNVGFAYTNAKSAALKHISIEVTSGKTVAFVGPSGSGKSTMVKLIAGLYHPIEGEILVNESNIRDIDADVFRRRIGLVAQETQLFAGTIRENLQFVRPGASDEECRTALESAAAHTLLERATEGLDTRIGEGGMKISGGERQRLAIARALLRDPELIIFDEATSSLDSITEKAITATIKDIAKARPNLMTILVAHRLSTIMHADRIYVFEKGQITEQGTHQELLDAKGLYAALWREQIAQGDV